MSKTLLVDVLWVVTSVLVGQVSSQRHSSPLGGWVPDITVLLDIAELAQYYLYICIYFQANRRTLDMLSKTFRDITVVPPAIAACQMSLTGCPLEFHR